ncbi:FecR family protein [Dyadobacter jiangsuensis]|uniref:FecR family protein n=1 Tax=Dyadobacter jiangsuensis TaxID=1591085 RepID=A0A2P8GJM9_9BACT|nr:FecR domain-containing protein [Dyadobacter jiangsuensis]PSL34174.1 FecR family protein [Dyadobacter jiangsuensis]
MDQYQEYTLEDFVLDARFQGWVRHRGAADAVFWQQYLDENPAQAEDIQSARKLLDRVYRHYRTDIDEAEIDLEIQGLLERVRAEKRQMGGRRMEEREDGRWEPGIVSESGVVIESEIESGVVEEVGRVVPLRRPWHAGIWVKVAACAVLVIGLGWVGWQYYCFNCGYNGLVSGKELVERVNTSEKQQVIKLTDGTQVVLYPQSRLSFAETFPADQRTVYLSGDAYFQVAKDPKRPFLVHTTDLVTKVLGTSFFVRARDASDKTLVEVREGKVSVFKQKEFAARRNVQSKMPNGMVLTPNQKLIFEHASSEMRRTLSDNPEIVPSDNPKTFEFVNAPASSVLTDIEEAYQIDIIFDRDVMKGCPVTASLAGQPMFSKLSILCEVIEARYEVLDGKVVIYSKGCKS